jgi:predicted hotdog family 3-hydroxylacyl-ACP dehydratase
VIPEHRAELERLLPHRPPMLLLDRLIGGDGTHARALAVVRDGGRLVEAGRGLPAWALVEVFAQAAALIGGLRAREEGIPVAQGFLLGTRRLDCPVAHVPVGTELLIEARTEFTDGAGMGAYHCRTLNEDWPVECVLTVYTPPAQE